MAKPRYNQGEVNCLIDAILHPLIEKSDNPKPLAAVDGILHLINEGKLEESVRKTIAYRVLPALRQKLLDGIEKPDTHT